MNAPQSRLRLYSHKAERLYLNRDERCRFARAADTQPLANKLLCLMLLYTGCRLSEARYLRKENLQISDGLVVIRSLKKRDQHHVRQVPLPQHLLEELDGKFADFDDTERLWQISRSTAWRQVKAVMHTAGIRGAHASPKGLRHSFGMYCAFKAIPITLCCKWMGHSNVTVTAIYYQLVGRDEIEMAERLWE